MSTQAINTARVYPQLEGRAEPSVAAAMRRAYDLIYHLQDQVNSQAQGITVTTPSGSFHIFEITLTADTEISSPATPDLGARLTVKITQDPTGGHQITWPSDYEATTPVNIDVRADKITIFHFIGLLDGTETKWWMVSYRTGV